MENDQGVLVDLYVPRKCSATNRLIISKDHASVQINIVDVDANGRALSTSTTFALCGQVRSQGESDDSINRLATKAGLLRNVWSYQKYRLAIFWSRRVQSLYCIVDDRDVPNLLSDQTLLTMEEEYVDPSPIWDSLDIDLFVKVAKNTIFSPFFVMLIPTFYLFQGAHIHDFTVISSSIYLVLLSLFWATKWLSHLKYNKASFLYAPRPLEWSDQIVVITGGASGVGELLANTLAVKSVTVIVLDVKPIQSQNYNINFYKCDVSNWEEVDAVSKKIIEEIGQPTILINNAGVVQGKLLLDLTPEDVKQTFNVNTLAHFWTLKAFLPGMIAKKKGHIVTVASVMGIHGVAQMTDYCASKAALINLNRSLRSELDKRYNCPEIRTTLVCAGHIHTQLFATLNLPNQFLFPQLHPIDVVKPIIQALDDTFSHTILLPFYANFLPWLGVLPHWVSDISTWLANADFAMSNFVKLSGRRAEEGPAPELPGPTNGHAKSD
ncbi:hypothetical protein MKEN_00110700 [Mycena kentingensis (nom. inval.)]|nr:hypothetical protein MKEN_00110700 [Mycena kentingensis (nom. inval.)]